MVEENDQIPSRVKSLQGKSTLGGGGGGDNGADGSADAAEAERGQESLNSALNLDQKDGSLVLSGDGDEVSTGDVGDLGLQLGDGGGHGDDVANGALDSGEVKTTTEETTEETRLKLGEEVLATGNAVNISDGENVLESVTLDVAGDGLEATNDGADKAADLAETKAVEEVDNFAGQLDEGGVAVVEDGGDLVETGAAAGVELVNGVGCLDDLANGLLEGADGQLAHQALQLGLSGHLDARGSSLVKDGKNLAVAGTVQGGEKLVGSGALGQVGGGTGRNGQAGHGGGCGGTGAGGDHRDHGQRDARGDDAGGQARGNSGRQSIGGARGDVVNKVGEVGGQGHSS